MNRRSFFGKLLGFALFAPTVKEAVDNVSKEKTVAPVTYEQVMEAINKVHDKLCSGVAVSSMHLSSNCPTTFSTVNLCYGTLAAFNDERGGYEKSDIVIKENNVAYWRNNA